MADRAEEQVDRYAPGFRTTKGARRAPALPTLEALRLRLAARTSTGPPVR
ncbi:hypothetical protein ACIQ7Q_31675 [Streptomyces sp. NPDC096176]